MKSVILVGTTHTIQRGSNPSFREYIESIVSKFEPRAIAEELDNNDSSVAKKFASAKQLPYSIIEPTPEERQLLGIPSIGAIESEIFMDFDDLNSEEAQREFEKRKQEVYRAREQEWLKRLNKLNVWPVLVICGASHYAPFCDLLTANGFTVIAQSNDWDGP